MPKQWRLLLDEIALSGYVLPLWPAVKALCEELKRQALLSEDGGRYSLTDQGLAFYQARGGDFVKQALARKAEGA